MPHLLKCRMILVSRQDHMATEQPTAHHERDYPYLPGLSPVGGKPLCARFDGDGCRRTAGCCCWARSRRSHRRRARFLRHRRARPGEHDPRLRSMIRARLFAIACGYEDCDDLDVLRASIRRSSWPVAVCRRPDEPTDPVAPRERAAWRPLGRMGHVDDRSVLRQLQARSGAHRSRYRRHRRCRSRRPAAGAVQRPLRRLLLPTPSISSRRPPASRRCHCSSRLSIALRRRGGADPEVIGRIRRNATGRDHRAGRHYATPEAMEFLERQGCGGLSGARLRIGQPWCEDAAVRRAGQGKDKVRRTGYQAKSWSRQPRSSPAWKLPPRAVTSASSSPT